MAKVGGVCGGDMHGRGNVWQGPCMVGGVHGRGAYVALACTAGACMVGGMRGRRDGHCSGRYVSYRNAFSL